MIIKIACKALLITYVHEKFYLWIGPDGKVKKHWKKVAKAADHPEKVLKEITS